MNSKIDGAFADYMWKNYLAMATYTSYAQVCHFKPWEVGDEPSGIHMNLQLMWKMDIMRDITGRQIYIHTNGGFVPEGHKKGSWHCYKENEKDEGKGFALDFHIEDFSLQEMFRIAVLMRFSSIGVYPYWNNKGLHVDMRPDNDGTPQLWMRNALGNYVGLPTEYTNLLC